MKKNIIVFMLCLVGSSAAMNNGYNMQTAYNSHICITHNQNMSNMPNQSNVTFVTDLSVNNSPNMYNTQIMLQQNIYNPQNIINTSFVQVNEYMSSYNIYNTNIIGNNCICNLTNIVNVSYIPFNPFERVTPNNVSFTTNPGINNYHNNVNVTEMNNRRNVSNKKANNSSKPKNNVKKPRMIALTKSNLTEYGLLELGKKQVENRINEWINEGVENPGDPCPSSFIRAANA